MKTFCIVLVVALQLASGRGGEVTETVEGANRRMDYRLSKYFGETYVAVGLQIKISPGQFPEYRATIYTSGRAATELRRSESLIAYAGSNGFTFTAELPTKTGRNDADKITEFQFFHLTPVQMRDLCSSEVTTFHIRGDRGYELLTASGELQKFFRMATNAGYAAARLKSPFTEKNTPLADVGGTPVSAWKFVEKNPRAWRCTYEFTIPAGTRQAVTVQFLDADGQEIDRVSHYDAVGKVGGSLSMSPESAARVKSVMVFKGVKEKPGAPGSTRSGFKWG
jgi:hypothetical protein